jgi:hypothetical protein
MAGIAIADHHREVPVSAELGDDLLMQPYDARVSRTVLGAPRGQGCLIVKETLENQRFSRDNDPVIAGQD